MEKEKECWLSEETYRGLGVLREEEARQLWTIKKPCRKAGSSVVGEVCVIN